MNTKQYRFGSICNTTEIIYIIIIYSPVTSACHIIVPRANFKVIEDQSNLLIWRRQKEIRAIGITRIIARISRRIEFAAFTRRTTISEGAAAIGRRSARYLVFRFKSVSIDSNKYYITSVTNNIFIIISKHYILS